MVFHDDEPHKCFFKAQYHFQSPNVMVQLVLNQQEKEEAFYPDFTGYLSFILNLI